MNRRDYTPLMAEFAEAYAKRAPKSAALHERAIQYMIDGGSNTLRLLQPFSPRIVGAKGAWLKDEDGHQILDFWQGHHVNVLGHNPEFVTAVLAQFFSEGLGLQTGFTDRLQIEVAEILCRQTGAERVRFTTTGSLATMNAIILARAFTGRDLVLKVGSGWHGGHPWGLKGVFYHDGFESMDSAGVPEYFSKNTLVTGFNNPDMLHEHFRQYGDRLACFIVEPIIGAGGLMPAKREYLQAARELTQKHGVVLILDEVISGFRFRAGNAAALYGVQPDLMTLGKAIGGGMPVAAVAGRADILSLAGRGGKVKFDGGTYAAHPACMLAGKTYMRYLIEHETEIYPKLYAIGARAREAVTKAFADAGIYARFAGDRNHDLPGNSMHMLLFPYEEGRELMTPEEVRNPAICDLALSEKVLQLGLLLENVFTMHGLGSTTTAHTEADIQFLGEACRRFAQRVKPYL
ncbi:MAG: aspartate aminotransferase family protein [bacterium]